MNDSRRVVIKEADDFYRLVCRWKELIKEFDGTLCGIKQIRKIIPILSDLTVKAVELPEVEYYHSDNSKSKSHEKQSKIDKTADEPEEIHFEEEYRNYQMLLFPYKQENAEDDQEPCWCDLEDDMNDITRDLARGMLLYEKGDDIMAIDYWKSDFYKHWGRFHATQALYAMQHLILNEYLKDHDAEVIKEEEIIRECQLQGHHGYRSVNYYPTVDF